MQTRRGGDRRQEAAFAHPDVRAIVETILRSPRPALVKLAKTAITFRAAPNPTAVEGLTGFARGDASLLADAQIIAEAGLRITAEPDTDQRARCRGAVAERLVYELVRSRNGAAHREREIKLIARRWSTPAAGRPADWSNQKDVVLDLGHPAFEVYETKLSAYLRQEDLDEMGDIERTAKTEGTAPFSILATLESNAALGAKLRLLTLRGPLFLAPEDTILELSSERPRPQFS